MTSKNAVNFDEPQLNDLLEESQDLHTDAMRQLRPAIADLGDIRADRARTGLQIEPIEVETLNRSRVNLLQRLGLRRVVGVGALGAAIATIVARPASALESLDIQMLQTSSSLEQIAIATYEAALALPFIAEGNPVVKKFAEVTMQQHSEHSAAFQAMTKALGGTPQTTPNPKYTPIVEEAKPTLKTPIDVVKLAIVLEQVATETYLNNLAMYSDTKARSLTASVMGVECQHLATLRAVGALLDAGAPELIKIPLGADIAKLPASAGSVAFPEAFEGITKASPAEEGAIQ